MQCHCRSEFSSFREGRSYIYFTVIWGSVKLSNVHDSSYKMLVGLGLKVRPSGGYCWLSQSSPAQKGKCCSSPCGSVQSPCGSCSFSHPCMTWTSFSKEYELRAQSLLLEAASVEYSVTVTRTLTDVLQDYHSSLNFYKIALWDFACEHSGAIFLSLVYALTSHSPVLFPLL